MSQQFLERGGAHAGFDAIHGERVAEDVRSHLLWNSRSGRHLLDDAFCRSRRHTDATARNETNLEQLVTLGVIGTIRRVD